jgi:hypothetical protein
LSTSVDLHSLINIPPIWHITTTSSVTSTSLQQKPTKPTPPACTVSLSRGMGDHLAAPGGVLCADIYIWKSRQQVVEKTRKKQQHKKRKGNRD